MLGEAAVSATRTDTFLGERHRRIARRRGKKRAIVAIGFTFHDRRGLYGRTRGAKRIVAVDVAGLPVGPLVVPASTHENRTSEVMLQHLTRQGVTERRELVHTTTSATGWLQVPCIATTLRHLSAVRGRRRRVPLAA
ncbi:hypothetical protein ACI782_12265 [Geodermatophilus sp. SYSU D00703]